MNKRSFVSCVLSFSLATATAFAAPAPKGAPPGYETAYREVILAEQNEEYEKALVLLDQIPAEKHNVYTKLKRAGLLVRLGKFVEAEAILSDLLKNPAAEAIRATVQGDLDDLRARMPKLTVRLADASAPDVWVTLDGKPIGPPVAVPVNPGTHLVSATRAGTEIFKQKVTLQDSQTLEVEIDTSIAAPAPPVANVSVPPKAEASPVVPPANAADEGTGSSALRRAMPAFSVGVVFALGLGASRVAATLAARNVEANCLGQHASQCDVDAAGGGRVRTFETLGWISGGLALASIGVGIGLYLTAPEPKRAAWIVTPTVGSLNGIALEGRF